MKKNVILLFILTSFINLSYSQIDCNLVISNFSELAFQDDYRYQAGSFALATGGESFYNNVGLTQFEACTSIHLENGFSFKAEEGKEFRASIIEGGTVGVSENETFATFALFPNPAQGIVTLEVNSISGNSLVEVYNINGQLVFSQEFSTNTILLDLSNQQSGLYLVKCLIDNKIVNTKLLLE